MTPILASALKTRRNQNLSESLASREHICSTSNIVVKGNSKRHRFLVSPSFM